MCRHKKFVTLAAPVWVAADHMWHGTVYVGSADPTAISAELPKQLHILLFIQQVLSSYPAGPMHLYLHWLLTFYALWTTRYVMLDTRHVHNSISPWPTINQIADSKHHASCTCHNHWVCHIDSAPYLSSYCHLLTKTVKLHGADKGDSPGKVWYAELLLVSSSKTTVDALLSQGLLRDVE